MGVAGWEWTEVILRKSDQPRPPFSQLCFSNFGHFLWNWARLGREGKKKLARRYWRSFKFNFSSTELVFTTNLWGCLQGCLHVTVMTDAHRGAGAFPVSRREWVVQSGYNPRGLQPQTHIPVTASGLSGVRELAPVLAMTLLRNGILPATSVNKGIRVISNCSHHGWWAGEPWENSGRKNTAI